MKLKNVFEIIFEFRFLLVSGKICGALRNLVPFVQFKKRENHPLRSVNFSKVAG